MQAEEVEVVGGPCMLAMRCMNGYGLPIGEEGGEDGGGMCSSAGTYLGMEGRGLASGGELIVIQPAGRAVDGKS